MRAYLIDPYEKTIYPVSDFDGELDSIYAALDCRMAEAITLNAAEDVVYVDEEGLLKDLSQQAFFVLTGNSTSVALAGRGLVVGTTDNGDACDPIITLRELSAMVSWQTLEQLRAQQH